MIVSICDDVLSDPVDRHSSEAVELSLGAPVGAELPDEDPVAIEDLDSVVGRVRYYHGVVWSHGYPAGPGK